MDLMQHIIKLFVPPRGIVLEFGHSYTLGKTQLYKQNVLKLHILQTLSPLFSVP